MDKFFTEILVALLILFVVYLISAEVDKRREKKMIKESGENVYNKFAKQFADYYRGCDCRSYVTDGILNFEQMIHECADFEMLMNDPKARGNAIIYGMMYEFRKMFECPECGLYLIDGSEELEAYYNAGFPTDTCQWLYTFIPRLGVGRRPGYDGDHGEAMRAVGLIPDHHSVKEADIWVRYYDDRSEKPVKARLCDYKEAPTLTYEDIFCGIPVEKRVAILKKISPCSMKDVVIEYLKSNPERVIVNSMSRGFPYRMDDNSYYFRLQYIQPEKHEDK